MDQSSRQHERAEWYIPRLSWAEWLVFVFTAIILITMVMQAATEFGRQETARQKLALGKAARLACVAISAEQYGNSRPFADFTTEDGFAPGVQDKAVKLGSLDGEIRLLQTDKTGYSVIQMSYQEGEYLVLYNAENSAWSVYRGEKRLSYSTAP